MSTSPTCVRCQQPLPADYDSTRPCPACLFALGLGPLDDEEAALLVHTGSGEGAPAPDPEELGPLFPQLEIVALLGQGGMGAVYRARQTDLDRNVALKILSPRVETEAAFAERFAREARALAKLSHPNIVAVHDFGRAGPHYYLVMELVEGTNLRHLIQTRELSAHQSLEVVEQVCAALQYAHDQGVVHRDIKPENILIDRSGRAKIADFGLAKMARAGYPAERLTRTRQAMGTPQYMAPEQIEHPLEVDHRADIYSLGVVFYELLTGELPLGRFAAPSKRVQLDVRLDEVVLRALEKEPERRYQQASEVATDIEGIKRVSPQQASARREEQPAAAPHEHRRHSWGWIVAVLALVALLPLGCFMLVGVGLTARQSALVEMDAAQTAQEAAMAEAGLPVAPSNTLDALHGVADDGGPQGRSLVLFGLGVLGLLLLVGFLYLLVRALRGSRRRSGRSPGWGWILLLLLLISCLPIGCFAFLVPAWFSVSPEAVFLPAETTPAPPEPQAFPEEPALDEPLPSDEEIQRLYEAETAVPRDPVQEEQ